MNKFKADVIDICEFFWWFPAFIPLTILFDSIPKLKAPWQVYVILTPIAILLAFGLMFIEPIFLAGFVVWFLISFPIVTFKWIKGLKGVDKPR